MGTVNNRVSKILTVVTKLGIWNLKVQHYVTKDSAMMPCITSVQIQLALPELGYLTTQLQLSIVTERL
jgi:hypothetical protein